MRYVLRVCLPVLILPLLIAGCRSDNEGDVREFETPPPEGTVVDTITAPVVPPAPDDR